MLLHELVRNERAEHRGPLAFEVSVLLETLLKQSFNSLQRLGPGQRGLKRVEGAEKIVGGRQRHLVDKTLCRRDCARIEGGDPTRECIDKAVQLFISKRAVDVPILRRSIAVEVVGAKNDFERAAATAQSREAPAPPAPPRPPAPPTRRL